MPITEYRIEIPSAAAENIEALLAESGLAEWMVIEDRLANRAWVAGYFASRDEAAQAWRRAKPVLPRECRGVPPVVEEIADADWRESYMAHFKAWRCGRLHWVPEWERTTHRLPRGHAAVFLDPGLAFGTGNHETTRLCCQQLVKLAQRATPAELRTWRVIDAGCGSGILAISAAKLGLRSILAFDNDADAVAIARENARRNGVASLVRTQVGDVATILRRRTTDVLLANIQADVLIATADALLRAIRPGGVLVLSGILALETQRVVAVFRAAAPRASIRVRTSGEWSSVTLRSRPPEA